MVEPSEMEIRRTADVNAVIDCDTAKKLVVAGPGTGKTFLFKEALSRCKSKGLALTFIRNLVDDLKQSLTDCADVFTFHGFCKHQLHRHAIDGLKEGWDYYPPLPILLTHDLHILGHNSIGQNEVERSLHNIDDKKGIITDYLNLGEYYNAVSHTDLVYRMLRHFERNIEDIPLYPLIVVDEYQDFSGLETSLIRLLTKKNPVLIAGDDDQALYGFKNASSRYIRKLAHNPDYKMFGLSYCSRCTDVVVNAVNETIKQAIRNNNLKERIPKDFYCYLPGKLIDSQAHPTITHAHCTVERKNAPYCGRYITHQIEKIPMKDIRESHAESYPTVLVIGKNPFLKSTYDEVKIKFPQATLKKTQKIVINSLDGYRRLAIDARSQLGWRIIVFCNPFDEADTILMRALENGDDLSTALPSSYRKDQLEIAEIVHRLLNGEGISKKEGSKLVIAVNSSIKDIKEALQINYGDGDDDEDQEGVSSVDKERPSIVCTSLVGAKGLSAGYVFIVGLNDDHFPRDPRNITDEEVCCFLVGLSRTRKSCCLVSCGRLGNKKLQPSVFVSWLEHYLKYEKVDASYIHSLKL